MNIDKLFTIQDVTLCIGRGDQFEIRKEVYRLMQEAFKEENIEFAHKNVTVYMPTESTERPSEPSEATQDKVKQAAALAAEQTESEASIKPEE